VWERIRNKPPSVYGSIEHIFYAFKTDKLPLIPDMWDKDKPERHISNHIGCTYFSLNTMVGVGAKGQNNIKSVHIRFVLMPIYEGLPEPEVVSIIPTNISRKVGEIKEMQKYENERTAGGGVKATGGYGSIFARIGASIGAGFRKQFLSSKVKESTLPNELLIANASGTANRAIWEFYRGDGIEAIGQYNLQIIFRLRGSPPYKKRFCYCVDWNVEVNGRKLMDHTIERENNKWNVEVNGRKLMAHVDDRRKNQNQKQKKYQQKNDCGRVYYNIKLEIESSLLTKLKLLLRKRIANNDDIGKRIVKLIREDDPDIDKRLLRPLVLFDNSEGNQKPKGSYPYWHSWKKQIKRIECCETFVVVEATVLSNCMEINNVNNKKHSKHDKPENITYVLLGDDTGVIILIDNKNLGKLKKLKKDDKVRVIGAEGNKVYYDIEGIEGILKYRDVDLYVKEYTWIEKVNMRSKQLPLFQVAS
jgi:hypothetical protein